MWVGLVFVACLGVAAPGDMIPGSLEQASTDRHSCREFEVLFDGSMMQCIMFGQQRMAHWLQSHADWRIEGGYRCKLGSPV